MGWLHFSGGAFRDGREIGVQQRLPERPPSDNARNFREMYTDLHGTGSFMWSFRLRRLNRAETVRIKGEPYPFRHGSSENFIVNHFAAFVFEA
ncbi:hypothetical protein RvY_13164-2 [Ramazzottius varieornatus]|uniref:Uncharacterized protein n=1 Tax=Ramazzottius varieornatus TaxID=947166 RepID=A0A1D1VUH7_RAMVA|nr:hypothetical protein RvY_13164-2 [Ramazzottius varieornatus]